MKKKIIALLLVAVTLLQLVGCASNTPIAENGTSAAETTAPPPPPEIILNADGATYKLIRSEDAEDAVVTLASELRNTLSELAGNNLAFKIDEDWVKNPEDADNDSYELLIGLTNRPESAQAAEELPGYKDFSISVIENKLCIYANSAERLGEAVNYFLGALTVVDGKLIYAEGNYVGAYAYPMADMMICDTPINEYKLVLPANAANAEKNAADELMKYIRENSGFELDIVDDSAPVTDFEILIGATNRAESANIAKEGYKLMTENKKLSISAASSAHYSAAQRALAEKLESTGKLEAGFDITAAASALDLFLTDNYAAGLISEEVNIGVLAMLSCLEYFNDRMVYGSTELGERWVYSNKGANAKQTGYFDDMLKSSKKGGNCASPVNWALCEMGIVPKDDRFYGGSSGEFKSYSGNARQYLAPYVEVTDYHAHPISFKELYESGEIKAGDIFLCKGHTFVYRGDETFYAAGHDGAWHTESDAPTEDERKAVFDNWVLAFDEVSQTGDKVSGKYNANYNYDVHYVVRLRDDYVPAKYRNADGVLVDNPMVAQ